MESIKRNWWWLYSLISGIAMVFYLSAWVTLERAMGAVKPIPMEIIAMGALSSALFYMILRWPKEHRKSPYRFAALYGALLSSGAYVIQCQQFSSSNNNAIAWLLILSACAIAAMYAPGAILKQMQGGIRKYYLAKTCAVAWCWSVWALLPLLFLNTPQIAHLFGISFLFISGMVIITDALDGHERQLFFARRLQWLTVVMGLIFSAEVILHIAFKHHVISFGLVLSALPALVFSQTRYRLLAAFLVDGGLMIWYVFLSWNAVLQTLP